MIARASDSGLPIISANFFGAGAIDLGKVDGLGQVAIEAGHFGDDGVIVSVGIAAIMFGGFLGARQIAQHGVVHDEAEFLL